MAKETAFVLPEDASSSGEPQTFPGVPGLFTPGEPVPVSALGVSATEMRELAADLPLKQVTADPVPDGYLDRTGGIVSGAAGSSEPESSLERSVSDIPGLSAEEADAVKAEREAAKTPAASMTSEAPAEGTPETEPEG